MDKNEAKKELQAGIARITRSREGMVETILQKINSAYGDIKRHPEYAGETILNLASSMAFYAKSLASLDAEKAGREDTLKILGKVD